MYDSNPNEGQIKALNYVTVEKARLYRAVMGLFAEAKARFALHLRPREIHEALVTRSIEGSEALSIEEVEAALRQLCDWGNLAAHPDTAEVATVEEFYRPRYLFQLTKVGEAAEMAIVTFAKEVVRSGELQAAALSDICDGLAELKQLAAEDPPDTTKVHRTLRGLCERFDELTSRAQSFMSSLQRATDLHEKDLDAFLAYKETLIDYLERFIRELIFATAEIAGTLNQLAELGMARLLTVAAKRELADAIEPTEADHAESLRDWQGRWEGFRAWFIARPGTPSQSQVLRARARAAIPTLLNAIAGIHDRRTHRSDRATDLRTLARWFAQTDTDEEAHRLWRAAFGLAPARHLGVDTATLDAREAHPIPGDTSWREAPPLVISPRLRRTGRHAKPGRSSTLVDRTREKEYLARQAEEEARQMAAAQDRLLKLKSVWLSDIGELSRSEFDLLCDLLGEAVADRIHPAEQVTAMSPDGSLQITLGPNTDGRIALVSTEDGELCGLDHWITVTRGYTVGEDQSRVESENTVAASVVSQSGGGAEEPE